MSAETKKRRRIDDEESVSLLKKQKQLASIKSICKPEAALTFNSATPVKDVLPTFSKVACDWKLGNLIGKGAYGKVYLSCCNDDCNYTSKIINLGESSAALNKFNNEVKIQQNCAENIDACPNILDTWNCAKSGVIIMPLLQITLKNFIEFVTNGVNILYLPKDRRVVIALALIDIIYTVKLFHSIGYIHDDLHDQNVMASVAKKTIDNKLMLIYDDAIDWYIESDFQWKLIDLGRAYKISDDEIAAVQEKNLDYSSLYESINDHFENLFTITYRGQKINMIDVLFRAFIFNVETLDKLGMLLYIDEETTWFNDSVI